jgi:hypothetical protein
MLDAVASILVDLSEQKNVCYNGESGKGGSPRRLTGKASTPTPLMTDSIATKYELTDLIGRNYSWRIRDVPHVMCFSKTIRCIVFTPEPVEHPLGLPGVSVVYVPPMPTPSGCFKEHLGDHYPGCTVKWTIYPQWKSLLSPYWMPVRKEKIQSLISLLLVTDRQWPNNSYHF